LFTDLPGGTPDHGMLAIDNGAHRVTEVAQQVPPIGDLYRIRCALARAVRIGAGPVVCDDLDPGVLTEPVSQGLGLPVRQDLDHRVAIEVDQDGSIVVTPAPTLRCHSTRCARGTFGSSAQSSTARTRGVGGGALSLLALPTSRSKVSALVGMANRSASR